MFHLIQSWVGKSQYILNHETGVVVKTGTNNTVIPGTLSGSFGSWLFTSDEGWCLAFVMPDWVQKSDLYFQAATDEQRLELQYIRYCEWKEWAAYRAGGLSPKAAWRAVYKNWEPQEGDQESSEFQQFRAALRSLSII